MRCTASSRMRWPRPHRGKVTATGLDALQAAVTQRQAAPTCRAGFASAEPAGRQLPALSWKGTPGLRLPEAEPEGHSWNSSLRLRIPRLFPQPAQLRVGVAPFASQRPS